MDKSGNPRYSVTGQELHYAFEGPFGGGPRGCGGAFRPGADYLRRALSGAVAGYNFAFPRVQFNSYRARRRPGWAHDYPRAEQNLLRILHEVTGVYTSSEKYTVVRLDSPDIMRYPVLYFSEPGSWTITPEEAENFRSYLLRGGFAIIDDFDGPWDWQTLESCMAQVLPGRHFELLTVDEPIFQSFFHIPDLDTEAPMDFSMPPTFHGLRDDEGRIQVIANFNNDIGDYWEWSDEGWYPIDLTNEGYKFGINYIIYALTH